MLQFVRRLNFSKNTRLSWRLRLAKHPTIIEKSLQNLTTDFEKKPISLKRDLYLDLKNGEAKLEAEVRKVINIT